MRRHGFFDNSDTRATPIYWNMAVWFRGEILAFAGSVDGLDWECREFALGRPNAGYGQLFPHKVYFNTKAGAEAWLKKRLAEYTDGKPHLRPEVYALREALRDGFHRELREGFASPNVSGDQSPIDIQSPLMERLIDVAVDEVFSRRTIFQRPADYFEEEVS